MRAKLTEADVRSIRAARVSGAAYRALARHYGVYAKQIKNVVHGVSWSHVK